MINILVVGDSCIDEFVYGGIFRMSPEAPVPVFQPVKKTSNGGMSKNVYNNLIALGVSSNLVTNIEKIVKRRYVDDGHNQMVLRVDTNDECSQIDEGIRMNICNNHYMGYNFDAMLISDYNKGFLTKNDIELLCKSNNSVFVDTKKDLGDWIFEADFIKINDLEYKRNSKFISTNSDKFKDKLIVTRGRYGCEFNDKIFNVKEVVVRDVSGAGDTFLSALVVEYVRTNDVVKAINFAQVCATVAVQKHGVSVVTQKEIKDYE
jgi:D-beta-D-heptose 7-phosphate kinase/D-beta-D-heptose 1-phosphate adenosyltransferase